MTGARLVTGLIVMGVLVPAVLVFLLGLQAPGQIFVVVATCTFGWGVADLVASILSRPRLDRRSPTDALRRLDLTEKQARQRGGEEAGEDPAGQG